MKLAQHSYASFCQHKVIDSIDLNMKRSPHKCKLGFQVQSRVTGSLSCTRTLQSSGSIALAVDAHFDGLDGGRGQHKNETMDQSASSLRQRDLPSHRQEHGTEADPIIECSVKLADKALQQPAPRGALGKGPKDIAKEALQETACGPIQGKVSMNEPILGYISFPPPSILEGRDDE